MCYATGSVPCSDECDEAGRCLLSSEGSDMDTVKICVAGGREFDDYEYLCRCMDSVKYRHGKKEITLISGAAKGADKEGEKYAKEQEWAIDKHPPNYDVPRHLRRKAPLVRNEEMAQDADVLVAFWDGASTGTRHMIGCALRNGLEIHIFRY